LSVFGLYLEKKEERRERWFAWEMLSEFGPYLEKKEEKKGIRGWFKRHAVRFWSITREEKEEEN